MLLFSKLKYLGNLSAVEGPGIGSNGTSYLKYSWSYSAGICAAKSVVGLTSLHNYSEGSII